MNLEDIIGRDLAADLTPNQRATLEQAATQHPTGLRRVADEIHKAGTNITSPIAVLLSRVNRNQHATREEQRSSKREPAEPLQRAHSYYVAKMAQLPVDWTEEQRVECAIDYALDWCGASGQTLMDVEDKLRSDLGQPRFNGTKEDIPIDPTTSTEHRQRMRELFGRDAARLIKQAATIDAEDDVPW